MGCAIGITLEGDGGHRDQGTFGQAFFQAVIFRLALCQAEPPAVIVDDDAAVIRVVEARCTAIECGVTKVPLRRGDPPDKIREVTPVSFVAGPPAFVAP